MPVYPASPLSTTPETLDDLDPLLVEVACESESYRYCLLRALEVIAERDRTIAISANQVAVFKADDARLQEVIGNLREELRRYTARVTA